MSNTTCLSSVPAPVETDRPAARAMAERFFADLTIVQPTAVLGLAQATANRDWVLARAWLFRELRGDMP